MTASSEQRDPIIGREAELAVVNRSIDQLAQRGGGTLAVVGPAGVGKSRLARESARRAADEKATVLVGRAVAGGVPTPYRPLIEALAPWARTRGATEIDLGPHGRALGVLVPGSREGPNDALSPVFVAESLVRLLPTVSDDTPVLLLVEDLHWADEETLAAVEYLADAAESLPLLLVLTGRDDEGTTARQLFRALAGRGAARLIPLGPLTDAETADLARARLGATPSPALARLVADRAEGLPLFIEELVAALDAAGSLSRDADTVDVTTAADAVLPDTVGDTVATRLDAMTPDERTVIEAAALLGRSFDLDPLLDLYAEAVTPALENATRLGLLHEDPDRPGQLRFRHALLRDGVVASTFPPRRTEIARHLLDRLPLDDATGDTLSIAVELAARSGDEPLAARLGLRRARGAYDRWALATAERAIAEARRYAGDDPDLATEIDLEHLRIASIIGRIGVVLSVGRAVLTRLGTTPGQDAARLEAHLVMAQAHLDEGRWAEADEHLAAAEPLIADPDADPSAATRLSLISAQSARQRGDQAAARDHAVHARTLAEPNADQALFVGEALFVEGRAWLPDVGAARNCWTRALDIADAHGLRVLRGDLLADLATLDVDDLGGDDRLHEAHDLAIESGIDSTVARVALLQARLGLLRGDLDNCEAHLWDADELGASATVSRDAAADLHAALAVLRYAESAPLSADATILAALVADDLDTARATERSGPRRGPLALFADIVAASPGPGAVAAARSALPDLDAAMTFLDGGALVAAFFARVWAAESTTSKRDPLLTAVATFDRLGLTRPADACRALLRADGLPLPRRTAALDGVPAHLRAIGVTGREHDVLMLIAEGRSNRDVAAALYLSPRTVEKHVERLLLKTGSANRTALAAVARPGPNT